MKIVSVFTLLIAMGSFVYGQYDPAAGTKGSLAISQDSAVFVEWAESCEIKRGYQDISKPNVGKASTGSKKDALGFPDIAVVSLGDGGAATLQFKNAITNGKGPDFAIFENSFRDDYLELAFVEVSSDGKRFVRFPAISLTDTTSQKGPFGLLDPTKLNNLAGKHRGSFGTPFDLELLKDSIGIDVDSISHVRIVDVVGSVTSKHGSRDYLGNLVNDPWPTPFESSGFDLDAVGVINARSKSGYNRPTELAIYPSILRSGERIRLATNTSISSIWLVDLRGKVIREWQDASDISTSGIHNGMYTLLASSKGQMMKAKVLVYE